MVSQNNRNDSKFSVDDRHQQWCATWENRIQWKEAMVPGLLCDPTQPPWKEVRVHLRQKVYGHKSAEASSPEAAW